MKSKPLLKRTTSWLLMIQKNPSTEEVYVNLPPSLTTSIGWADDDSLIWTPQKDGSFKVSKVEKKKK